MFDIIYILLFPFFFISQKLKGKWHEGMKFRLGEIPEDFCRRVETRPNIWFHAVSAGEVLAVADLIKRAVAEYPDHNVICSTVTLTGFELASASLKDKAIVIYAPIDFSWTVRKFLDCIQPKIYISAETEIWPNLYRSLGQRNVPVLLINGRISDKSWGRYQAVSVFLKSSLEAVKIFAMQTAEDAQRIESIGADPSRVKVAGNLKFDTIGRDESNNEYEALGAHKIFLAGSTHPGEEDIVLDAFKKLRLKYPHLRLMLAPRHVERAEDILRWLAFRGFKGIRLSQMTGVWDDQHIVVVDRMGVLRHLYGIATAVFVGKTFKVGGGQNMIEPLVYGKPTFVGPLTENFRDVVRMFVIQNVLFQVDEPDQLADRMASVLGNPVMLDFVQRKAPQIIREQQGATQRILDVIRQSLPPETA